MPLPSQGSWKTVVLSFVTAVTIAAFSACGGGGTSSSDATDPTPPSPGVTANPPSLEFGNVPNDMTASLPTSIMNNESSAVTVSSVVVTGAGFSASGIMGQTQIPAGQSATLNVQFAPTVGGSVTGANVTIMSNATNSPTIVALGGAGEHYVELSWTESTANVTFNVLRATTSGQEDPSNPINNSPILATTYMDTSVVAGQEYYYEVQAVNSAGTATSGEASATVPTP